MTKFKPNFRALREAKRRAEGRKITLYEIGKKAGVSPQTLTRWDNEDELSEINAGVAAGLMEYFGVSLDELVSIVENGGR